MVERAARRRAGDISLARVASLVLGACALGACGAEPTPAPDPSVLMTADRAFAADVARGGSTAWASWFAPDGAMIQPGVGEISGRNAIEARMASLDSPAVSLRWEPRRADIAASGDLGWTTGSWVSEAPGPIRSEGLYVSIWRKQADGSWKVVMDLGNPVEPAPGG